MSIQYNIVHASDSPEAAREELNRFLRQKNSSHIKR